MEASSPARPRRCEPHGGDAEAVGGRTPPRGTWAVHVHAPCTGSGAVVDPDNDVVERTLELALPLSEEAAGSPVKGLIGNSDPVRAVSEAIGVERFEEVVVSTLP